MFPKVLIVVTCLYVVGASVVPSIFDDNDSVNLAEVTRTARSCSYTGCNTFCRKQGHARGVCIGTYCQCRFSRRRRSADEEAAVENAAAVVNNENSNYEELSAVSDGVSDSESETFLAVEGEGLPEDVSNPADVSVRSCGYTECNNFCRKMGYARGVCIGNYCQCRSRIGLSTPSPDLQQESVVEELRETEKKAPLAGDELVLDEPDHERYAGQARSCGVAECNNHCRRLGHARGVCIGTYCQCRSRLARSLEDNSFDDNLVPANALVAEDESAPEVHGAKSNCNLRWCEQNCRRIGFPGGACVNGRCKCDGRRSALPAVPAPSASLDNSLDDNLFPTNALVAEDESVPEVHGAKSDCNLRWCEQNCRRIGFPGGACVNGRCKCDVRRSTLPAVPAPFASLEDQSGEEAAQSRAARSCSAYSCAQICRRLGFRFSRCSGGRCYCW